MTTSIQSHIDIKITTTVHPYIANLKRIMSMFERIESNLQDSLNFYQKIENLLEERLHNVDERSKEMQDLLKDREERLRIYTLNKNKHEMASINSETIKIKIQMKFLESQRDSASRELQKTQHTITDLTKQIFYNNRQMEGIKQQMRQYILVRRL
ncbi:hypothetical protein RF11_06862 [Thelohanellus kitauei]|uniref:Uncharacterized protein n=1 Tax=Thelohanellus kitauei TaxID=669202 RepID=A0A0C2N0T1_THEKT|nr:hypothetical protein RF11_06862 [Thelohanellus kitauei]